MNQDAPESEREFRDVVFFYDSPKFGLVRVDMSIDQLTAEQRRLSNAEAVSNNDYPNSCGEAEVTTIRGGTEAILGYPPDRSVRIAWREGRVMILVAGPTLTPKTAIEIAEQL